MDTPIQKNHQLGMFSFNDPEADPTRYRAMIGSLMYLKASRPNIMFAVCMCARYQSCPRESHMKAVKRYLRYLKGKPVLGLWYSIGGDFKFIASIDTYYGGCNFDRKSTSGGCQFLRGRLVSWQCKKQTSVAISSCEAEYMAAVRCCSQVLWIQQQLRDYGQNFLCTLIKIHN
uniref:secreted RxLR effector protein 161-like n=1 Tax=Erigeron canadensis TaxID=72917 RepID=UPI001CB8E0E4|nr:secreted RxLR effector protein 161-like [Erigeron canadensis]